MNVDLTKKWLFYTLCAVCCMFMHVRSYAQGTQASIRGAIRNVAEAPIAGATVRVKNESTGFTTSTVTNERGNYDLKQLPLGGPYTVTATHVQDGEGSVTGVHLNQGDVAQVDIEIVANSRGLDAVEINAAGLKNTNDY